MAEINIFIFLIGLGLSLIAGTLGCFIVWRKMAYFGDALSHSALLGVALGLLVHGAQEGAEIEMASAHYVGILFVAVGFAVLLVWLGQRRTLSLDVLLGILSHGALALGLLLVTFLHRARGEGGEEGGEEEPFDFHDILLGDLSAIGLSDVLLVYASAAIILGLLFWQRRALLLITLSEDLAKVEGVKVVAVNLLFMILMALFVMVAAQLIGVLLIASLLIVPAASARQVASSYYTMVLWALLFGGAAIVLGLGFAVLFAMPAGASIVSISLLIFFALLPWRWRQTL